MSGKSIRTGGCASAATCGTTAMLKESAPLLKRLPSMVSTASHFLRDWTARISPDTVVFKQGKASVRLENFDKSPREWARVSQEVQVHPYRCYRLTCWIKSENMGASDPFGSGNFQLEVLGGDEKRPLQYQNPRVTPDAEWQKVTVGFNSWGYEKVEIAPKV